jgi:membrane protein YdbS with pleckstrin-like domain
MLERARAWLLRVLRVPPEPALPEGARDVRVFRAAPGYYRYRLAAWALKQAGALFGLLWGFVVFSSFARAIESPWASWALLVVEGLAWTTFAGQLALSLAVLRLDFELRWYIVSDRSLRIRDGILSVREKTITFANVQNIAIRQNPLQRMLGIADVKVATAGGGNGGGEGKGEMGETMHEGYFRGVANAEEIRTAIQERVRLHRDSGLGDPDEPAAPAPVPLPRLAAPDAGAADALAAARELRDEMRALRGALAAR